MKNWGAKRIHQGPVTILDGNAYAVSQIKIWLQKSRNGILSCKDVSRQGRPPLTLGPELRTFLEMSPFAIARVIARHFFTTVPTTKHIVQRELGMKTVLAMLGPRFSSSAQKAARVEASRELLRILQGLEANRSEGIATRNKSWFRYSCPSSKMFARSPAEVIPRTQQAIGDKKTMITLFFTARKLIFLDALPKGHKYNQQTSVDYILMDLKKANLSFHRCMLGSTFAVGMDSSLCHNGSKVMSKFGKHDVSRFLPPPYSPDISLCDFWVFGMLKGLLKDQELSSSDEIEMVITRVWDDLTFDNVQSLFQN
jgi:hypothetical protein